MIPKVDLGISKKAKKARVIVAMSGGVDSSVAAALVFAAAILFMFVAAIVFAAAIVFCCC